MISYVNVCEIFYKNVTLPAQRSIVMTPRGFFAYSASIEPKTDQIFL